MKLLRLVSILCMLVLVAGAATGCKQKKKDDRANVSPVANGDNSENVRSTGPNRPETYGQVAESAVTSMAPVYFAYDSSELSSDARTTLGDNASWIRSNKDSLVIVEGHCDERGTEEYNQALGERRARAARDYLVALGATASNLQTISYGESQPAAFGSDESAWARNRRAEFKTRGR